MAVEERKLEKIVGKAEAAYRFTTINCVEGFEGFQVTPYLVKGPWASALPDAVADCKECGVYLPSPQEAAVAMLPELKRGKQPPYQWTRGLAIFGWQDATFCVSFYDGVKENMLLLDPERFGIGSRLRILVPDKEPALQAMLLSSGRQKKRVAPVYPSTGIQTNSPSSHPYVDLLLGHVAKPLKEQLAANSTYCITIRSIARSVDELMSDIHFDYRKELADGKQFLIQPIGIGYANDIGNPYFQLGIARAYDFQKFRGVPNPREFSGELRSS